MLEERRSIGVSDGIMCVMGQYVKEMALFNGLWKAG